MKTIRLHSKRVRVALLSLLLIVTGIAKAQLVVTDMTQLPVWNADSLVRNVLMDQGVSISNVKFNGSSDVINCNSIGIFNTGSTPTNLGIESGIIIVSGGIQTALGPNNSDGQTTSTSCGSYYDSDLASIASGSTNDVAVLEFDFVPWDDTLQFRIVFGSEEYMEYVGSGFNDVFGFFVDGINPAGGLYEHQNVALIPGTNEVVSINNVNLYQNANYYIDNTGGETIQFDGFTTVLEVSFNVVPLTNYHIKMAICDVGDSSHDSGVFLEAHSFSTDFLYDMVINGWSYTEIHENYYFCSNHDIEFQTVTNWNFDDIMWYFGDGTSAQGNDVTHTYEADGIYTVTNVIHNPHRDSDSLFISTEIEVRSFSSEEEVVVCGNLYLWHGQELAQSGVYTDTLASANNCDSITTLFLTIHPSYHIDQYETACSSFYWNNNLYTESGDYVMEFQSIHSCDSILTLHLTITNPGSLGNFTYMSPTNNYPFTTLPLTFTWDAVDNAQSYDLYLWNANDSMPEEPYISGLTSGYYHCTSLPNHQTYQWYVKAYNPCDSVNSVTRTFTLDVEPALNVSMQSINFGEVALSQGVSTTLNVSGTVLEDSLSIEITGEDAAMFSFTESTNWDNLTGGNLIVTFTPSVAQYAYHANLVVSSGTLSQTVTLTGSLANYYVFHTYIDEEVYPMNTTIPIHGDLKDANGNAISNAEVEIGIFVMGMKRTLQATTNENGEFAADFEPMPSESGYYTINSGHVGNHSTAVHDDFNIPGMSVLTDGYILCAVTKEQPKTDTIRLRNKSNLPLNNIQVSVLSAPEGCSFSFSPLSLGGLEEGHLIYTVTGTTLTQGNYYEEVKLKATSSEGAETVITVWYYCMEPRGVLDVTPKSLATTMTKGKSKIVDVMLANNGTAATGNITIDLPDVEWMSVVGNSTLPSIAVNDSAFFSLRLSPNEDIPLGQYSGAIAINCEHGEFATLPYQITAVSDSTGSLVVDVTDEYTWNTNGGFGPHLANAEVTLTGYFSLETVAHGYTDENGIYDIEQLPEGYYRLHVSADRHSEYDNVILIEAGMTNQRDIFVQYQGVTYSWNVVPTEIQDQYTFELISTFETNVPAPVITVEAPHNLPAFEESYSFNYVITNHGLISANDVVLHLPEDDDFLFTVLYECIDTLYAQTTIVIPCVVTHKDSISKSWRGECANWGYTWVEYTYECKKDGTSGHGYGFAYTLLGTYPCENTPPSVGGGGGIVPLLGIVGGGGSGFPNPFFTSPLLEMWYDCYNGCTHLVLVAAEQLLQMLPLVGQAYGALKAIVNLSEGKVLQSSFNGGSAATKLLGYSKISAVLGAASAIPDLLKDIPECYTYLHDSYGWKDFPEEDLEYVPDEIREMIVYASEYYEKIELLYDYFEMYFGDTEWLDSNLDELDGFMELVFEYDSIYGHVTIDPSLSAQKPSNIDENQMHAFIERYNNTRDLLNGMTINDDNYMPIDSLYTTMATILGIEYEAVSLGYGSGADRLSHLIDNAVDYLHNNQSNSVCAKVTVQFSQKMTMTREAFEGTFNVHNGHDVNAMEGIGLNFTVKDENGNDCTDLFQINTTSLTNLTAINGSGSLGAGMDGMAKILFIPTKEAALIEPKTYFFGGTFTFVDPYYLDTMSMELYPVDLTVHPSPDLYVDYFMQRDIIGDDALTLDVVEPSVPAELGVIINNKGAGVAKNVILETAEPKIIDNDKGLAIDFAMYSASFNGNEAQLGLMEIPFGNIESGHTAVGEWLFTSSLLGHFVSYEAHVIHNNSYGNPNLSLVSNLDIHELIHPIRAYGDLDDGINDFLVNDVADYYDYPDSIYFSHGGKTSVSLFDNINFNHYVQPNDTIVTLTVNPSSVGWNYGLTNDPGTDKYELVSCTRDIDNQIIPLNNIWQTFVTLRDASDPIYENKLHIVDTLSMEDQDITYTLVYERKRDLLAVEEINGIPQSFIEYPLESFSVKFNKPIADSTFTYEDMTLKYNYGSNLMNSSVVISKVEDDLYNVDISSVTHETGYYVLNIHTLNINDAQGYHGYDGKQATWIQVLDGDKFIRISEDQTICENDNFEPLTSLVIGDATSFQWNRDGMPIAEANDSDYQATEAGVYTLTVTFEDGEVLTSNEVSLVTYPSYQITIDEELCEGDDYILNGFNLTNLSFGIHNETLYLQNAYGCDSIVSLHLVVHENPEVHIQIDTITDNGLSFRLTATGATLYEWSTGETTASIIVSPTEETTYSVIGTSSHGCSDSAEVTVFGGTGIGENGQMSSVKLYPNPAHDKLFIKTSELVNTIEIYTMTGVLVQQQSCWSDNMEIDVQNLSSGIYVIRLASDHAVETRRFVKE